MLIAKITEIRHVNDVINSIRPDIIFFANGGFVQALNIANEISISVLANTIIQEEFVMLNRDYRELTTAYTSTLEAVKGDRIVAYENGEPLPMIYGIDGEFITIKEDTYHFDQFDFEPIKYALRFMKVKDIAPELSVRLGNITGEILIKPVPYHTLSKTDIEFIYQMMRRDGVTLGFHSADQKYCHIMIGKERVEVMIEGKFNRKEELLYGTKLLTVPSFAHSDNVGIFKLSYQFVRALRTMASHNLFHGVALVNNEDKVLIEGYDEKGFLTLKMFG